MSLESKEDALQEEELVAGEQKFVDGDVSILVAVRVRPMWQKEKDANQINIIQMRDNKDVYQLAKVYGPDDFLRQKRAQDRGFQYDHAFDENCSQELVYEHTTKLLLPGILDGFNATCFAYGATGAGKTHTMLGSEEHPGIMVLTLRDLFAELEADPERKRNSKVTLSYLEVYNEQIKDLLSSPADKDTPISLDLREDPIKGMTVAGITEYVAEDAAAVMSKLHKGNARRTTEATKANDVSSRSHAVLQIVVQTKTGQNRAKVGKLSLIDLAGSERARKTENSGMRLVEGANINRSLLALANCINALGSKVKGVHIPYRDSKLTRLLKDSLGGNCRTIMIAAIAPGDQSYEETGNTLKYAERTRQIKGRAVTRNDVVFDVKPAHWSRQMKPVRPPPRRKQFLAAPSASSGGSTKLPNIFDKGDNHKPNGLNDMMTARQRQQVMMYLSRPDVDIHGVADAFPDIEFMPPVTTLLQWQASMRGGKQKSDTARSVRIKHRAPKAPTAPRPRTSEGLVSNNSTPSKSLVPAAVHTDGLRAENKHLRLRVTQLETDVNKMKIILYEVL